MALDRPATVRIFAPGTRNGFGRWVPGAGTDYRVWVSLVESADPRLLEPAGARVEGTAMFRARWFRALAAADLALSHELIVDGRTYRITDRRESDASALRTAVERDIRQRRRWLVLTCVEER